MAERANDTAAKMLSEANQKVQSLLKENEALRKENDRLKGLVPTKLQKLPDAVLHEEPVEFGGKKYQLLLPKIYVPGHGHRTALEIAAEQEKTALATLIEMQSGAIKEVS